MQRKRNSDFEISSLLGFADECPTSCAGSCGTVLIGSRMSCRDGPQGRAAAQVGKGRWAPRSEEMARAMGKAGFRSMRRARGRALRERRCTHWVRGGGYVAAGTEDGGV